MTEDEQLQALCVKLGSSPAQAATMAAQLQKRAAQLAVERGITREAALTPSAESRGQGPERRNAAGVSTDESAGCLKWDCADCAGVASWDRLFLPISP